MSTTLNRTDIRDFMIRRRHKVEPEDYIECASADPKGIDLTEQALGKGLLTYRNWGEIFDQADASCTDGLLLRLQLIYSQYMLAKIKRALRGEVPAEDQITIGYHYYEDQMKKRHELLEQWVMQHPEDRNLLPSTSSS